MKSISTQVKNSLLGLTLSITCLPGFLAWDAHAEMNATVTMADFTSFPVTTTETSTPLVMMLLSLDHQLFFKAYNDYSDVSGDGIVDTTYNHSHAYYGYFDSDMCYAYDTTDNRFEPREAADVDGYCTGTAASYWSGNFLNWTTMTRIDSVRKLLYGGKRSTDSATDTVLERAFLPHDAHSFAKYYGATAAERTELQNLTPFSNNDMNNHGGGMTFCNTTRNNASAYSQNVTDPPLMRVAEGNWALWASNERWQCTWDNEQGDNTNANNAVNSGIPAGSDDPSPTTHGRGQVNYNVRVQVCVSGLIDTQSCRQYPSANYKPAGLLQKYGENEQMHFGLITGSFGKNKSGGVLRKNVTNFANEVNKTTDGTFTGVNGLVKSLNAARLYGYVYSDGYYNDAGPAGDDCDWGLSAFADGVCSNWGNPLSEMYAEALRYFKGEANASAAYTTDDSTRLAGLTTATWNAASLLSNTNRCAPLNIIAFNGSVSSYDGDGLGTLDATADTKADAIGTDEGINGKSYFVGESGAATDQLCTAKTVSALGDVEGLCPEAPRLDGTYKIAGLAYDAHVNDIRNDLTGDQTVNTFGIALAPALPVISVPDPATGKVIATILPACQNEDLTPDGNCALVDFKVVSQDVAAGTGLFYVNWEDSEQGGDFDQDMWGTIAYTTNGTSITVTTDVHAESTIFDMGFGYVIGGTTQDGFHAHSGIEGYEYNDPTGVADCSNCQVGNAATSVTYTIGSSSGDLLESPLFYAAKWGGFSDSNANKKPDLKSEWDRKTTDGLVSPTGDGIPDNYFFVTDPAALEKALVRVFEAILERTASGTAAAVVANTASGNGAAFQALYEPLRKDTNNNEVKWIGTLHGLWLDETGLLREDNPAGTPNGILDDYNTDPVVQVFYDNGSKVTRIRRWGSSAADTFEASTGVELHLNELSPIWNAREQLYLSSLSSTALESNRSNYTDTADTGRWIFSWFDYGGGDSSKALNGIVDASEQVPFDKSDVATNDLYGWFDAADFWPVNAIDDINDKKKVSNLVDYIRGVEFASGARNRTIDYDGDGTTEVMRMGDIIHATPTPVQAPREAFDLLYGDKGYGAFMKKYFDRRQVVYVSGNDGMIHAINAGFFGLTDVGGKKRPSFKKKLKSGQTEHPLGSELWAYVPMNLLPHLKWLKDPQYSHVYFADLKPRIFDAKLKLGSSGSDSDCPGNTPGADADHKCGWGTYMVAGMRLGGGAILTDTSHDGLGGNNADGDATDDITLRSSYTLFDITNPEAPPEVIAELSHPDLGYSLSYPAVVAVRKPGTTISNGPSKWYLIFGTGPTDLGSVTSSQSAGLLVYDLQKLVDKQTGAFVGKIDLNTTGAFTGDPVVVDWDLDYSAESIYIGTASGNAASPGGKLIRISIPDPEVNSSKDATLLTSWKVHTMLAPSGKPFLAPVTAAIDEFGKHWVYASTGRYFVDGDKSSKGTQTLYGMIDPTFDFNTGSSGTQTPTLPKAVSQLVNTTNAHVSVQGDLVGVSDPSGTVTPVNTFSKLVKVVEAAGGWRLNYTADGTSPAERGVFGSALVGGILLSPAFTPNPDLCGAEGTSALYGLYYKTGTATQFPVFGKKSCGTCGWGSVEESVSSISLGAGLASTPSVHVGEGMGDKQVTVIEQTSTGAIVVEQASTVGRVKSGEMSWREY
ncbi:MAG: hypothetical protein QNJ82_00740 [Gammaproteobacteria bacterium]|nr:hypothetical protein [Gammaproteobacteria bacterium]